MLDTQEFGDYLQSVGLRDFVGVPCSYLAPLINYAINSKRFIMSNNEGDAVAIASGISLCRLIHNNSSLGSHLQDCASLEAVITHKVTPAPKFTQNLQSNTALVRSTSPYLQNTRIVDSTPCHFERSEKSTSLESQVNSNNKDSQAEVSLSDFSGFQAKGEGSLLNANDRALSAESAKSTKEITPHNYGVVLMQNSGLSNALSPLTSLNYTFKIPILGFVSLRGERDSSGKNTDEPQHELLGVITDTLLETCEIKYAFLDSDMDRAKMQVQEALEWLEKGESFFFIVRDKTFSKVSLVSGHSVLSDKSRIASAEAAALTPSKLLASASQSHDLLKKPTAASLCTASLVFSSQSLECQDSSNMESQAHSTPCHTEALAEVSSTESKRDISPFSKARTSKALAHTCKYDKILESQADSSNTESKPDSKPAQPTSTMPTRLEALSVLHTLAKDSKALLLATTGKCGRELYEIEDSPNQLYMVGSMGCVSSLSLGIALKSRQKVIAIDGDSALLMRLGALSTNAYYTRDRDNFCHILLDNESHDSTGGQFNLSPFVDFSSIAKSCGYVNVCIAESLEEFELYVRLFLDARNSACGNSSLGSHLQDCASLEAVITHKVTPAPKFTQNLQSNTALVRSTRKALSGWGIFKGEGATSQFKPFLLKEKNKKSKNQNISNKDTSLTAQYDKVIESKTNPSNLDSKKGAWFIYLKIQKGSKDNLGRPKVTPQEVAQRLSEYMRGNSDEF